MKKCNGCHQKIDKYAIACEYCGKLTEERERSDESNKSNPKPTTKKN